MARIVPANPATCPKCGSKETRRVGYSAQAGGSLWVCGAAGCGNAFTVRMLVLRRASS